MNVIFLFVEHGFASNAHLVVVRFSGQVNTKPLCNPWIHSPAYFSRLAQQVGALNIDSQILLERQTSYLFNGEFQ